MKETSMRLLNGIYSLGSFDQGIVGFLSLNIGYSD